jgi:hypothetical protein
MMRRSAFLLGILAALTACAAPPSETAARRWLRCEECKRGELDSVVRFGDQAVGVLASALDGPPASERASVRRQSEDRYARLHPAAFSLTRYVSHYDSNFVAHYQAHAMVALGAIGTPAARAALHQAMQNDSIYRRDVIRALSRAAPIALDTAAGGNQAAPRDSLVRVEPGVRIRDSVSGQPLANILVRFTVDSGGGDVADSLRRTGPNGVASVPWTLGPGPDSLNVLRAEAFRRTILFRVTSHGLTPRLVFAAQPVNGTQGQPLLPGIQVLVLDAWDQRDTTFGGTAQARIMGTADTVSGPIVKGAVNFPNLVPSAPGAAVRIRVQAAGATPAVSEPFDVVP